MTKELFNYFIDHFPYDSNDELEIMELTVNSPLMSEDNYISLIDNMKLSYNDVSILAISLFREKYRSRIWSSLKRLKLG